MKPARQISIALAACMMLAAAGCRTAGVGNLSKEPSLFPNRTSESAAELLIDHNRNAEQVQTLKARSTVTFRSPDSSGGASGNFALERPKYFKLELSAIGGMTPVANIGSNDNEFWFWVRPSGKTVYYCNYDENGNSPLAGSLQPDWITEALGLKVYSDEEIAAMRVKPGIEPGTLVISQAEKTPQGESVIKEMVVSQATRRIREHRVYSGDHKTLLAQAKISEYLETPLPRKTDSEGSEATKVYLPKAFKLEWMLEKLTLEILMSGKVEVNPPVNAEWRASMFVEPSFRGSTRKNLMEREALAQPGPSSNPLMRETMPAPAPRVNMNDPSPIAADGTTRTKRDPVALMADLAAPRPVEIEAVVGPTIPSVNEPLPGSSDNRQGWRNMIER